MQDHLNIRQLYEKLCTYPEDASVPFSLKPYAAPTYYNVAFSGDAEKSMKETFQQWNSVNHERDSKWNVIKITRDSERNHHTTVKELKEFLSPLRATHPDAVVITTSRTSFTLSDSVQVMFSKYEYCFEGERLGKSELNPHNWWISVLKDPENADLLKMPKPDIVKVLLKKGNATIPPKCCALYLQVAPDEGRWIPSTDLDSWESGACLIKNSTELETGHCSRILCDTH